MMMVPSSSSVVDCLNLSGKKILGEGLGGCLIAALISRSVRCWMAYPLRKRASVKKNTIVISWNVSVMSRHLAVVKE